jgi:NifU-like protein involved in Fe-S cluster formation
VQACALGQASAALLGTHVIGRSRAELAQATQALATYLQDTAAPLPDWPGIETLAAARDYPARHASILLPFEAALEAIQRAEQLIPHAA